MRKNGIDKLAFLVVLGATVLVVVAAMGAGPAYSADNRTDPAEIHRGAPVERPAADASGVDMRPDPATQPRAARTVDPDGYEWSGSRPADQRYLWSHRPN